MESGEHQTLLREMNEFGKIVEETVAFQYPKSKAGAGTEPSEGERFRNVVLGVPMSVALGGTSDEGTDSTEDEQGHGSIFTLY